METVHRNSERRPRHLSPDLSLSLLQLRLESALCIRTLLRSPCVADLCLSCGGLDRLLGFLGRNVDADMIEDVSKTTHSQEV
jgi:hypothetical protein